MRRTISGDGILSPLFGSPDTYPVTFEIHLDTNLRNIRNGLPPVEKTTATVTRMQSINGSSIPAGEYSLVANSEKFRLKNLGPSWHVLSSQ